MHDDLNFDFRFDPKVAPLLPSLAARVLGSIVLTVVVVAPVAFVANLIGAIGTAAS